MLISEDTPLKLAVQTPWGLLRPLCMTERVSSSSGYFQSNMMDVFADREATIVIFDNMLVLANTIKDTEEKLSKI